ncbi:unnamed protein product [Notodromas monacha]|uniref:U-box domain-containing protein n=1 Tax=Notodromas monacha TaxID=399045 RepID=A0A7R9GDS6_9CRUS|nr:unnamed protein product [Notodromas monacha]CAG0917525.1 unnamed protein product [Notodromas monacha]
MLVDFALAPLLSRVVCDRPCEDDCGVANLLKVKNEERSEGKGLILASFVTSVAELRFEFKWPLELAAVRIVPRIGRHQTTALELGVLPMFPSGGQRSYGRSQEMVMIGRARSEATTGAFLFKNLELSPAQQQRSFPTTTLTPDSGPDGYSDESTLKTLSPQPDDDLHVFKHRGAVRGVVVRLLRGRPPRNAGVARIELWGRPIRETDATAVLQVLRKLGAEHQIGAPALAGPCLRGEERDLDPITSGVTRTHSPRKDNEENNIEDLYPEFFDPISSELMTFPMLLPSGHTVDKCTLDRYCDTEAALHHRPPNDPFTRIPFDNDVHVVVPHSALKDRIDAVLKIRQERGISLNLGRSVGMSIPGPQLYHHETSSQNPRSSILVSSSSSKEFMPVQQPSEPPSKRPRLVENSESKICGENSHADNLERSLADAIAEALADTPVVKSSAKFFTAPTNTGQSCVVCNASRGANLYQLACNHVLCRNCLLGRQDGDRDNFSCSSPSCGRRTPRSQITRVHVS